MLLAQQLAPYLYHKAIKVLVLKETAAGKEQQGPRRDRKTDLPSKVTILCCPKLWRGSVGHACTFASSSAAPAGQVASSCGNWLLQGGQWSSGQGHSHPLLGLPDNLWGQDRECGSWTQAGIVFSGRHGLGQVFNRKARQQELLKPCESTSQWGSRKWGPSRERQGSFKGEAGSVQGGGVWRLC